MTIKAPDISRRSIILLVRWLVCLRHPASSNNRLERLSLCIGGVYFASTLVASTRVLVPPIQLASSSLFLLDGLQFISLLVSCSCTSYNKVSGSKFDSAISCIPEYLLWIVYTARYLKRLRSCRP